MGEMADFELEHISTNEEEYCDFMSGKYSTIEAFERSLINELGFETRNSNQQAMGKTCKHCGAQDLAWKRVSGKWRLHSKGDIHECSQTQSWYVKK